MSRFTPDVFNMSFEAISAITFGTEAEAFSTGDAVVAHIPPFPIFITQPGSTRRIFCYVILYQVVSSSICILEGASNIFLREEISETPLHEGSMMLTTGTTSLESSSGRKRLDDAPTALNF